LFALQTLSLLLPIVVPGIVLIIALKKNWLASLDRPIDGGSLVAGRPLFGRNKTYRGVVIYVLGAIIVCAVLSILASNGSEWVHWLYNNNPLLVGTLFGVSYVAGELLNSFVKRRLSIAPGRVNKRFPTLQRIIDLSDGPVMATLVIVAVFGLSPQSPIALVVGVAFHWVAEYTMSALHLKK
jgi:hypothetical protein